jgi:hypothetical protein
LSEALTASPALLISAQTSSMVEQPHQITARRPAKEIFFTMARSSDRAAMRACSTLDGTGTPNTSAARKRPRIEIVRAASLSETRRERARLSDHACKRLSTAMAEWSRGISNWTAASLRCVFSTICRIRSFVTLARSPTD